MASGGVGRYARIGAVFMRRSVLITLAVLVALFFAYTLAGFFLVPRLVAIYVPRYVEQHLQRLNQDPPAPIAHSVLVATAHVSLCERRPYVQTINVL